MAGPLTDINVLDLTRILAGPWATQVLADYGATVWKIERPHVGDDTRQWGPPYIKDQAGENTQESAYYVAANRNKQSFAIDIKTEQGQQVIYEMVKNADIFIENYKVGGLQAYGLDYKAVKAINPNIIYCSITGFGQTGPYADKAGYDAMIQALGGLMSVTGESDQHPAGGPQKVGVAVSDLMTGMYAVSAILAALHHRSLTGQGQYIDLALFDTQVAWLANQASNYLISGEVPERLGSAHPNIAPYQVVKVAGGHMMLAVGNDRQFQALCQILGTPELAKDKDYSSNAQRVRHRDVLINRLEAILLTHDCQHWLAQLAKVNVPCAPINRLDTVFADPQIQHRQMLFELPHPKGGMVPQVANPVKFSETPIEYHHLAPMLNQHDETE
ncbi:CaiB/BaiF CoA transferase family protein [Thalassotalea maritima]|uniref:CaiB/BaiF CoA transferase family protein n=1 Tax=Thalassotalea maritima TaxID=3242416 RepID=UPI003527860E